MCRNYHYVHIYSRGQGILLRLSKANWILHTRPFWLSILYLQTETGISKSPPYEPPALKLLWELNKKPGRPGYSRCYYIQNREFYNRGIRNHKQEERTCFVVTSGVYICLECSYGEIWYNVWNVEDSDYHGMPIELVLQSQLQTEVQDLATTDYWWNAQSIDASCGGIKKTRPD